MEVLDIIKNRRSIRKYKKTPVEKEKIEAIIEAGRLAPSACNAQPWHFVVFNEEEAKNKFGSEVFSGIYSNTKFALQAPVLVVIVSDKGNITSRIGNMVRRTLFWVMDAGIAGENMALQAQSMGLGTCWIGWFDHKKAAKMLGLSSGQKAEILLSVGYPDESPLPRPRKELKDAVSYNKYKKDL
ncbi:Nitroreductase [Parelusimicrobium proximum]|uniref:nitroreductase family protein n=1 Tax=Parelusimicrobium proximum TaxID=3228953 RepID=UPI003D17ACD3